MIDFKINITELTKLSCEILKKTSDYFTALSNTKFLKDEDSEHDNADNCRTGDTDMGDSRGHQNLEQMELPEPRLENFEPVVKESAALKTKQKKTKNKSEITSKKPQETEDEKLDIPQSQEKYNQGNWDNSISSNSNIPQPPPENLHPVLMKKIANLIVQGRMTQAAVTELLNQYGIPSIPTIQNYPEIIPTVIQAIDAFGGDGANLK